MRIDGWVVGSRRLLAVGVVAVMLVGCSDTTGGFGLPTESPAQPIPGTRTELAGTLHVESDGCFTWEGTDGAHRWVVWPRGAGQDLTDGARVRVAGRVIGEGDAVAGSGMLADASVLPQWVDESSYFGSFGRFCGAGTRGIVVFDRVRGG